MGKRQPLPKRLTPDASRVRACVFRTPWGWMGISETTKGIDAVVLPKASRQAIARGAGATDRFSGRNAQVLRSVTRSL